MREVRLRESLAIPHKPNETKSNPNYQKSRQELTKDYNKIE